MESVYWVVSRDCNQRCRHCYNDSEPGAPGLSPGDVDRCVAALPAPGEAAIGRVIVSGGEPLSWPDLLFRALAALRARFGGRTRLHVQTNGDLLDAASLARLLDHGVTRIDVASQDRFHAPGSRRRRATLVALLRDHGFREARDGDPPDGPDRRLYAFWGANEDTWIGPLWPRGRARRNGLSRARPEDDFCGKWSGARNFLDYRGPGSEVSVQLADVFPCCPMTCRPLGSLLTEPLLAMLDRAASDPVFRALNRGKPELMGLARGVSEERARERVTALGNHCLWCDEFLAAHAPGGAGGR